MERWKSMSKRHVAVGVAALGAAYVAVRTTPATPDEKFKEWWDVADKYGDMSDFDIPNAPVNETLDGPIVESTDYTVPVEP